MAQELPFSMEGKNSRAVFPEGDGDSTAIAMPTLVPTLVPCAAEHSTTSPAAHANSNLINLMGSTSLMAYESLRSGAYDLSAVNLTYKVKTKGADKAKVLLNNVNAEARHGEILAIAGPSGAGKSTFLDAVAGRILLSSLQGKILINGKPIDSKFKQISGYVMQDDQLFAHLTVRETLMFSARLRITNEVSPEAKAARVEAVIQELGLTKCANTIIGNDQVRGVSGGEKRRVSIGVDLIHDPAVLFLDEPTSGLDSVAALSVIRILREIAEARQRTILMTIHQPSFRILELIHNYLLLARGSVVYHGSYGDMAQHFANLTKHPLIERANGLEYALDVIENTRQQDEELVALTSNAHSAEYLARDHTPLARLAETDDLNIGSSFATSFWSEVLVLTDRSMKNILRTRALFLMRLFTFSFAGVWVGALYYNLPHNPTGLQDMVKYFAFALMALIFTSTDGLPVFLDEREIFVRETSRGAYRTSSYVIAGTVAFLPFLFLTSLTAFIPYLMIGLARTATAMLTQLLIVFLTFAVGNSFIMFIAGFVPNFAVGVTVATAINAFFFLCSGFFIGMSRIPVYMIWLNYISPFKYALQAMTLNQMLALQDVCWDPPPVDPDYVPDTCALDFEQVLVSLEMTGTTLWLNIVVMIAMCIVYRFLFFLMLKRHSRAVRR